MFDILIAALTALAIVIVIAIIAIILAVTYKVIRDELRADKFKDWKSQEEFEELQKERDTLKRKMAAMEK